MISSAHEPIRHLSTLTAIITHDPPRRERFIIVAKIVGRLADRLVTFGEFNYHLSGSNHCLLCESVFLGHIKGVRSSSGVVFLQSLEVGVLVFLILWWHTDE